MKKLISLMALGLALAMGSAHGADDKAPTAQQNKMKTCNADAKTKELKGDERKKFMSECLSAKPAAAEDGKSAQQSKMKTCNADAKTKDLKGDERKKFMSECLSAK
ncbi:MAG: PsiF family protein [Rhodoferax sp.]|nr:PsiF family protein [Rhodoferax sp.]